MSLRPARLMSERSDDRHLQGRWCLGKTPTQTFLDSTVRAQEQIPAEAA